MKWKLLFLSLMLVLFACSTTMVSAGTFDNNGHIECGNENYSFASEMTFDNAKVNNNWVMFNTIYFNITSENAINITLSYLEDNILGLSNNLKAIEYTADTSPGKVWFNLSGFIQALRPQTTG